MALAETLTDNFNDNSIDGAKWTNGGSGQVVEQSGRIEISTQKAANYFQLTSLVTYDLTSSYYLVQILYAGNQTLVSRQTILYAELDVNNKVYIQIDQGNISANYVVAGTPTYGAGSVTYNPATHKWVRLREASGTTYFEYSTNGHTWSTLHSLANPITLTAVTAGLQSGTYAAEAYESTSVFDNFNLGLSPPVASSAWFRS